jgi:hypothetical protein
MLSLWLKWLIIFSWSFFQCHGLIKVYWVVFDLCAYRQMDSRCYTRKWRCLNMVILLQFTICHSYWLWPKDNLFCLCRSNHLLCNLPIWPDHTLTLHWFWWLRHHAAFEISFMHLQINIVSCLRRSQTEHGQCHINIMCSVQAWIWSVSIHCDW